MNILILDFDKFNAMGYVYLVQPSVLVGTNRYKIGMSALSDLSRLKAYGNGTRYICILECEDYREVEQLLIRAFDNKYKLVGGKEYFECKDEMIMLNLFVSIVMNHKNKVEPALAMRAQWMFRYGHTPK